MGGKEGKGKGRGRKESWEKRRRNGEGGERRIGQTVDVCTHLIWREEELCHSTVLPACHISTLSEGDHSKPFKKWQLNII